MNLKFVGIIMEKCVWNSLELTKVLISLITPLIGGFIALKISNLTKDFEKKQWSSRKIIEKRLEFYDKVVPELNDLYCYYHRVGNWKELTPKEIITKKRILDKQFNVYSHIFKNDILTTYNQFVSNCFETFTGSGNDAKLKMSLSNRVGLPIWDKAWDTLFVEEKMASEFEFDSSYFGLLNQIKSELEI